MKSKVSPSNVSKNIFAADTQIVQTRQHRSAAYQRVVDERKRPIRGLWVRNSRYYAQLTIEDQHTGQKKVRRIPLEGVATSSQARQKLQDLLVNRRKGNLPVLKRTPKFSEFADSYLEYYQQAKDAKRASTLETEKYAINQWKSHLGHIRLDQIKRIHIDHFIAARQKAGKSARTVNLEVTIFRNVLRRAIDQKLILHLPTENLRPLKSKPRKRQLILRQEIDNLLNVCRQPRFISSRVNETGSNRTSAGASSRLLACTTTASASGCARR
jgi:hypothetical protein